MENEVLGIIRSVGRAGASALFPNDIEYYAITIELVDSKGTTVDYLTFPVNPDLFTYDDQSLVTIRKTLGGVTSLNTSSFVPKSIVISGTFGRSFKLLLSPSLQNNDSILTGNITSERGLTLKSNILNASLKSGYGTIKVLERILVKSKELDNYNNPYSLYLYAPLVGHNFIVEYNDFVLKQDFASSNMIWKYNIQLTAIAPLTQSRVISTRFENVINSIGINLVQRGSNSILNTIRKSIF
jgi:hypothetical protein